MNAEPVRAKLYLLDVEGTVAPLSLTTELLFPYARRHFEEFLKRSLQKRPADVGEGSVTADLLLLEEENGADIEAGCPRYTSNSLEQALAYLLWLMDRDRKSTALKSLQGKIWKAGFESGELKGEIFAEVPDAFARWSARGKVAIYSSGSTQAQQLLFRHTIYGDLTRHIAGYFDTRTGPKFEPASYTAIAKEMQVAPAESIFFSDVVKELDAAREAGMETRLVARQGNLPVEDAREHDCIESFQRI